MQTAPKAQRTRSTAKKYGYGRILEAYGVRISIRTNEPGALQAAMERVAEVLPHFSWVDNDNNTDHEFRYSWNAGGRDSLYKNKEKIGINQERNYLIDRFGSELRLTVAENAVDRVFIHAGVVEWKGRGVIIPASSFRGKTTLTAELVRRGAVYYSDEYAILDADGYVHPFPKKLSIRGETDIYRQVDHAVESIGGTAGDRRVPIGMFLITKYKAGAKWNPKALSSAKGLMEIIKHTLPIRRDPHFTLAVLQRAAARAAIVKTPRGEAGETADRILAFIENASNGSAT
jgi:hypothetical protein